ncbi:MAG: peptidoglycan DD-metalloendopeptidase family protein [Clostridiales Family XIII bacterium]|jgi:murein DD-endopeptidase MepM/ murein hydrolase activator NlpD|nr:peptidoglycan DD-metalloendopeptidase family protein [Clostridiales Family XIII bacterium]
MKIIINNKNALRTRLAVVMMAALLALSMAAVLPGAYADDLQGELDDANAQLDDAKSELDQAKAALDALEGQIRTLQANIAATETSIAETEASIADYDAQIVVITAEVEQLEQEVNDQNSDLNQRLRVMYETGDESILVVLLGSENIVDFLASLDMIKKIHESDTELLKELERKLDEVEAKKADLVRIEQMLVAQRAELETRRETLRVDQANLDTAKAEAQKIKDAAQAEVSRLEAESKRIEAELAARESQGTYGGGTMSWPAKGTVTSEFGMRVNPITGIYTLHAGIDIGVGYGAPIYAAADGIVIYSQYNTGGYGNLVMIDNGVYDGSKITTCYAHNSSLAVSVGQAVTRGQVIAYAGSTGNSTGDHCHFEVRVNGTPTNPRGWL